jgi:hypothetical protein
MHPISYRYCYFLAQYGVKNDYFMNMCSILILTYHQAHELTECIPGSVLNSSRPCVVQRTLFDGNWRQCREIGPKDQ